MTIPGFLIKNGGTDFMCRQKNVCDILSVIEKETSLFRPPEEELLSIDDRQASNVGRKQTKRFRGKESMFKEPTDPPPRFHKLCRNPNKGRKWVKYSLSDVPDYDLSNEGNTAAALNFLKIIQERKEKTKKTQEAANIHTKHLFKIPMNDPESNKQNNLDEVKVAKSVFVCSKLIMPEYVVGQNKKTKKCVQKSKVEKQKEVYLDHIHVHEDE